MAYGPLKVSILCPTFQQVALVARCVESLVAQKTSFSYEVLVRDDGSTDGTQEVLLDLQRRFPDKIRLMLEPKNTYSEVDPISPLLAESRGELIALCEGDDYWISNAKLEHCARELWQNSNLVMVGHLAAFEPTYHALSPSPVVKEFGQYGHYLRGEIPRLHTSSMVLRKQALLESWGSCPIVRAGDMRLKVLAAETGETLVLPDLMSVIGSNRAGLWQGISSVQRAELALETYASLSKFAMHSWVDLKREYTAISAQDVQRLIAEGRALRAAFLWLKWRYFLTALRTPSSPLSILQEVARAWKLKMGGMLGPLRRR